MSMLQGIRCAVGVHRWGDDWGDDWGAHHTCTYCGRIRRIGTDRPPKAHDQLGLHP